MNHRLPSTTINKSKQKQTNKKKKKKLVTLVRLRISQGCP